jgi:hypothetical protein
MDASLLDYLAVFEKSLKDSRNQIGLAFQVIIDGLIQVRELFTRLIEGWSTLSQVFSDIGDLSASLPEADTPLDKKIEWLLKAIDKPVILGAICSGQLIPDTTLSFSSARAGAIPSLNW